MGPCSASNARSADRSRAVAARACAAIHMKSRSAREAFTTKKNRVPLVSKKSVLESPAFDFGRIYLPPSTYAQEKHKIEARWPAAVEFIRRKVVQAEADGVVVGISGGIDSAVTAYLSVEALGSRRVLGLLMPDLRVTPKDDVQDASALIRKLSIDFKTVDIAPIHGSFMKSLEANRLAEGNLRARIRMSILYYYANLGNRLVAGTGDRSELCLGYFTKYGDGGVDILPIADLYKTEVRQLGEMLGIDRRVVFKRSSPQLWSGHTAEGELGISYDLVDSIFRVYFDEKRSIETVSSRTKVKKEIVERLVSRYRKTAHKRQMPEICLLHQNASGGRRLS